MLGYVKMPDGTVATLNDDGYWSHPDTKTQNVLDMDFSLNGRGMISMSLPFIMTTERAARHFGGEAFEPIRARKRVSETDFT